MKRLLVLLFVSSLVLLSAGCAAISKKDKESAGIPSLLEPQAIGKFADIPVPVGFKLLPERSYAFESAGVRGCTLKYQGKASAEQAISFYKEQMLMYNWTLLNIIEYGERLMNFDRDTETCTINLLPKGKALVITISVAPKSQASKKSSRPVK